MLVVGHVEHPGEAGGRRKLLGHRRASLKAPYPPIERPATKLSRRAAESGNIPRARAGSSSLTNVQYRGPRAMSV